MKELVAVDFDPITYAAAVRNNPGEFVTVAQIYEELKALHAAGLFINRIWRCLNVEELKAELERQWEPSKPYPEYRVRLKESYDRRKKELGA